MFTKKNFIDSKKEFSHVARHPLDQAFSIVNIKAGFSKCGIYPFNPDAVAKYKMLPSYAHRIGSSSSFTPSMSDTPSSEPLSGTPSSSDSLSSPSEPPNHQLPMSTSYTSTVGQRRSFPSSVVSAISSYESIPSSQEASFKFSPINPLVVAGLLSEDLSDILVTPPNDQQLLKQEPFSLPVQEIWHRTNMLKCSEQIREKRKMQH